MDYVSFCAAVEPKHGGRDLDNQERELDKAWKMVPPVGDFGDAVGDGKAAGRTPLPLSRSQASGRSRNSAEDGDGDMNMVKGEGKFFFLPRLLEFSGIHAHTLSCSVSRHTSVPSRSVPLFSSIGFGVNDEKLCHRVIRVEHMTRPPPPALRLYARNKKRYKCEWTRMNMLDSR